jgi:glycosyltransferase involved in cell wall biosynthesis
LKLGVVATEFFELGAGRMGGFGWAAREVVRTFAEAPELGVEVVLVRGEGGGEPERRAHGARLLAQSGNRLEFARRLQRERIDLLLTIDYRKTYLPTLFALPRTPVLVWVRDPRPAAESERIARLRVPGAEEVLPPGLDPSHDTSLGRLAPLWKLLRRPVVAASPAPVSLAAPARGAYALEGPLALLPNPIRAGATTVRKAPRPRVVYLGRLDPIKRPWVFVELASRRPGVDFVLMGDAHVSGPGTWQPRSLPDNVRLVGHADEAAKRAELEAAWILVNTSVHEALAVSFLEALAFEVPIVACTDTEDVVRRFGLVADCTEGSGLEGVHALVEALDALLGDPERRARLGREGRRWVEETHSREAFLRAFFGLAQSVGVAA